MYHIGLATNRRIELTGHMVVSHMVVTGQIELTWTEMADCWTLQIGEEIDTCIILVLIQIGIMIFIIIILTRGAIGDIFWMILRNKSHLLLMER